MSDQKERDNDKAAGQGLSSVEKAAAKLAEGAAFTLRPPVEDVSLAPASTRTELPSAGATVVQETISSTKPQTSAKSDAGSGRTSKHVNAPCVGYCDDPLFYST